MLVQISWRNVWRNKARSVIIMLAIALGLIGGIFLQGFMNGMITQARDKAIANIISNVQIHTPEYLLEDDINFHIPNIGSVESTLNSITGVASYSSRVEMNAILSSAEGSSGVMVYGIDAENEPHVTGMNKEIIDGAYLSSEQTIPIIIGSKMAETLSAKVKSRLVLGVVKPDGEVSYGAFKVVGIFDLGNDMVDGLNVFVNQSDLLALLEIPREEAITEIAVKLEDNALSVQKAEEIKSALGGTGLTVKSWEEVDPIIKTMMDMTGMYGAIFVAIVLIAAIFGVINTMLMVILERTKEIGMLHAIGMTRRNIFLMIMLETIFLTVSGAILGMLIGSILIHYYGVYGLNLQAAADGLRTAGFDPIIYPFVSLKFVLGTGLSVVLMAIIASLSPARKATKLKPAEAIRS